MRWKTDCRTKEDTKASRRRRTKQNQNETAKRINAEFAQCLANEMWTFFFPLFFYLFLRFCFVRLFFLLLKTTVWAVLVIYSCFGWRSLFWLPFCRVTYRERERGACQTNRSNSRCEFCIYHFDTYTSIGLYVWLQPNRLTRIFIVGNKSRFVHRMKYLSHQ